MLHGDSILASVDRAALAALCARYGVKRLSLFGSVLRDDFGPESDVDVLVEFEPGKVPGLLGIVRMERELSQLFGGRRVDLRTARELSRFFRDSVVAESRVAYDA